MNGKRLFIAAVALACLVFGSGAAFAQSALAGVVKDTTGAVLPGVTVEAASPAIIEKVRSVVTDGQGNYKIVDLRPGSYVVTFTLPGFSTVKREGIDLPSLFTATVNAEMRVGAVEETIVVTGAAPLVDVQNTLHQTVLKKDVLEALPVSRVPYAYVPIMPAVVGVKIQGLVIGREMLFASAHGGRAGDGMMMLDGVMPGSPGVGNTIYFNPAVVQEFSVQTSGNTAEHQTGGILMNIIPREGGNRFNFNLFAAYGDDTFQGNNLTENLISKGVTSTSGLMRLYDVAPAAGGPLKKDRLWFFSTFRKSEITQKVGGMFYNLTPQAWVYTPDFSRPARSKITDDDYGLRLTWQATPRNKFNAFVDYQPHDVWHRNFGPNVSPETTTPMKYRPNNVLQFVWKSPVTSRVLLDVSFTANQVKWEAFRQTDPAVDTTTIPARELSTDLRFRAGPISNTQPDQAGGSLGADTYGYSEPNKHTYRAALSYVTGSHNMKFGFNDRPATTTTEKWPNGDLEVWLLNGAPRTLVQTATPYKLINRTAWDVGVFAQDQWTLDRLTLNYGLRYDYINEGSGESHIGGQFVAPRTFAPVEGALTWHDLSPRLGAAYDLGGDGKTAIKATLNRYTGFGGGGAAINPVSRLVTVVNRPWTDSNGNFHWDCNLNDFNANGECGRISNLNFGQTNPSIAENHPDFPHGFGKRGYNWETSATLQRQLAEGLSVTVAYFRRRYGNFSVTDNVLVGPEDFDPYCITAPIDSRLPNGGGYQVCGLYDIKPAKFGLSQNVVRHVDEGQGKRAEVYNGVDVTGSFRFGAGGAISGGMNIGSTAIKTCNVFDSPQVLLNCDSTTPWQPNFKFLAVYPLPWWGFQTSVTYQRLPGPEITAAYAVPNAQIVPSLGRNLSAGAGGTVTVPLVKPGTMYAAGTQQVDFRLTKIFRVQESGRIQASVDVINLLNEAGIPSINSNYGSRWQFAFLQPQAPRAVKFSAQVDF